jgi:hypothetical protein
MSVTRAYAGGHFEATVDGSVITAYVKQVEGGDFRENVLDEPIGSHSQRVKHLGTTEIEPISIECGFAGALPLLEWIQASWRHKFNTRNGQITHASYDLKGTKEHHFREALISEVTIPSLDVSSKDPAFLKVKFQPEDIEVKQQAGAAIGGTQTPRQKLWSANSFRFTMRGIPDLKYTSKIESFTIKQGVKKFYTGPNRLPELAPTNLVFPNLSCTIPERYTKDLDAWSKDRSDQREGSIEFLGPDKQLLFTITLYEVGLSHLTVVSSSANQDQLKKCKFELFVGRMDIEFS